MARKEPSSSSTTSADTSSYLPLNNEFHNFHQLMNSTNGGNGNKNRVNLNNNNHLNSTNNNNNNSSISNNTTKQLPMPSGHNSTLMSQQTSMTNASIGASGMRLMGRPPPPSTTQTNNSSANVNAMLSNRHLPFPYNFHNTGGY